MFEYKEKKKIRQAFHSRYFLALSIVFVVLLSRGAYGVYQKSEESREKLETAKRELSSLEKREERLLANISRLQTDRGIEEEIRGKFRVAKEGEEMIILLDGKEEKTEVKKVEKRWWEKWMWWKGEE